MGSDANESGESCKARSLIVRSSRQSSSVVSRMTATVNHGAVPWMI